jgi:hypothetical protein
MHHAAWQGGWGSDGEGDAALDAELTRDLHFGGGLFEKKAGGGAEDGGEEPAQKKSKKEVGEGGSFWLRAQGQGRACCCNGPAWLERRPPAAATRSRFAHSDGS